MLQSCCSSSTHLPQEELSNKKQRSHPVGDEGDEEVWVRSYLNVTSAMHAKDGYVCVAVQTSAVRHRNAAKNIQNLYVCPQHLRIVKDDDEEAQEDWQDALPYIVIT